ncbi:MAG: SDR family oxidoreductase [Planctomycetota bacterium]
MRGNDMNADLSNKVILVTGGTGGIGQEIVRAAAQRGAQVSYCARHEKQLPSGELDRQNKENQLHFVRADISSLNSVRDLVHQTVSNWGQLDAVINNAAMNPDQLLLTTDCKTWDSQMGVNLQGPYLVAEEAAGHWKATNAPGNIVNIGSLASAGASSNPGYSTSKAGLAGLTTLLDRRYAESSIFASHLIVGFVETEMTDTLTSRARELLVECSSLRRAASLNEIANAALFLATDSTGICSGRSISATGGLRSLPL